MYQLRKRSLRGSTGSFWKKIFVLQIRGIYANFCTVLGYDIRFACFWLIQMRKRAQKSTFHEFYKRFPYFFAFSSCITKLYQTFFSSSFVSKDAEFRGLSDGRFKFLGQVCSSVLLPQIQLKSPFWTIDPPSLLEDKSITKHFALNI